MTELYIIVSGCVFAALAAGSLLHVGISWGRMDPEPPASVFLFILMAVMTILSMITWDHL